MFRNDSPFDTSSFSGSIQSSGFSTLDRSMSQISNISRPSAKSIYLQRMNYAASLNKMMEKTQHRVEHLFTFDLDGTELRDVRDCVERLKLLDQMSRIWAQDMMLEVRGSELLLTDIETKEELESFPVSDVKETKAVMNDEMFSSLLILSIQTRHKGKISIFMFQCEEVRADYVEKDLSRVLSQKKSDAELSNRDFLDRTERGKPFHKAEERKPDLVPQWKAPEDDDVRELDFHRDREDEEEKRPHTRDVLPPLPPTPSPPPRLYTQLDRDVDILNHIINDIEVFMGKVAAAEAKNTKKKKKKKKGKAMDGMPLEDEFRACLHKIKTGFNLLGDLNGKINNPSVPDFVHSLFSVLRYVRTHCSEDLPPTIVAPLFTPQCIRLLSEEATDEEDKLWQALGDAWNIPSTKWPEEDEDIPTYTLEFSDGWEPPEVSATPPPGEPEGRRESPRPSPSPQTIQTHPPADPNRNTPTYAKVKKQPSLKSRKSEVKIRNMKVKHDFISRNPQELSVSRGEVVELLDMSKQWWKVRNSRREEGYVPNNVLQDEDGQSYEADAAEYEALPVLTRKSRPAEVRAWLEHMEFNQITVRCLGVLSGSLLLGMSRDELKTVCPEEGGRVFLRLQAVKSALAEAS